MMHSQKSEGFVYWKRPWQKWLMLIGGILQILSLWLNIREYQEMAEAGVFSASMWESYAIQQSFLCLINGFAAALFLGIFLIGIFVRSQRAARLAEGLLLLASASVWGIAGLALHLTAQNGIKLGWCLIWLMTFIGSVYTILKSRNS